jgi:hypothetical protein
MHSFFSNQIDFKKRKVGDVYNDCLMSIHGTDFQIQQKGPAVMRKLCHTEGVLGASSVRERYMSWPSFWRRTGNVVTRALVISLMHFDISSYNLTL